MTRISFSRPAFNFLAGFLALLVLVLLASFFLPSGVDWTGVYRPAALSLLYGQNPYEIPGYYNPPWTLLFLIPFAVLPEPVGRGLLFVLTLVIVAIVAIRLGANRVSLIVFLCSPPVLQGLLNSNVDWLVLLGFILPPRLGLFFLAIKPQVGLAVAIYHAVESWRAGGMRRVMADFLPFTFVLVFSWLIFGFYPSGYGRILGKWWNASLFPASIPIGLVLLIKALVDRKVDYSFAASPFLAPHVVLHSWAGALLSLVKRPTELLAAVIGLWLLVLLRTLEAHAGFP